MVYGGMREEQGGLAAFFRCRRSGNQGSLEISKEGENDGNGEGENGGRRLTDEFNEREEGRASQRG